MSSLNTVRFFIYGGLRVTTEETQHLVNVAYQTARDRRLFPMEVLIRSGVHNTTKINGKYRKDPLGPHVTLCYKTEAQLRHGTHVASHGYVKSMNDWTYQMATHDPEKVDDKKKRNGEEIWPAPEFLRELPPIEYSLPAEYMEDWARTAEGSAAAYYNQTLDFSLSTPAFADESSQAEGSAAAYYNQTTDFSLSTPASAGESSEASGQQAQESLSVNAETDTFAEVVAKESHYFKLKLKDGSTVRSETSRWQNAYAWHNEAWVPCYMYVSLKSGTRYWTWALEPSKSRRAGYNASHKKDKGKK